MNRKPGYPQPSTAPLIVIAFLATLLGIGIPTTVAGMFQAGTAQVVVAAAPR